MAVTQAKKRQTTRKKQKRIVSDGSVYINATFNNTIITFTDRKGNGLGQCSAGEAGYKGSRKSTPFAAGEASKRIATRIKSDYSMMSVNVFVSGPGPGRDSAIRSLIEMGYNIESIEDVTPIPHNGCRQRKKRRV